MISNIQTAPEVAPEEVLLTKILQKKLENTDQNTVLGASIMEYRLHYISGSPYYNGTIIFQNGDTKEVSFIPFDKAEGKKVCDIYTYSTNICDERVLRPWYISYCEDICEHIICYDRFHYSLRYWLPRWTKFNSVKDAYGLPHSVIKTQISKLLKSVNNIHKSGLLHLSLSDISNYVVIDNNWYIINVGGNLKTLNLSNRQQMVIKDFQNFGNMLEKNVLLDTSWRERNDFLNTFANNVSPNRLVLILLDNVFTKSSYDRLQMFSKIHHEWKDRSRNCNMLNNAISNGVFNCYITNGGWDKVPMGNVLSQVYQFSNKYDGQQITSLLKFCRNVFEHYYQYTGNVKIIENEMRQLWPGFLERLLYYY
ncbi:uncharacterized protein LOC133707142 [Rosa rugosa]|uniref:uncharacterized protein LOC133707142 n=1 Tax=Rosa rugosa TaxID=74645 RepID=UPI002B415E15|nr:uncharacterized protein LOC133707142 [Rosa rugosa]